MIVNSFNRRDSCAEDGAGGKDGTCFKYYSDRQPSKGCGLLSIIGSGEVDVILFILVSTFTPHKKCLGLLLIKSV